MRNLKTLLRLGDDVVVVKEDVPVEGEDRLYVAVSAAKQYGAALNPAQVRGLVQTLTDWLRDTGSLPSEDHD